MKKTAKKMAAVPSGVVLPSLAVLIVFGILWFFWPMVMHRFASGVKDSFDAAGIEWGRVVESGGAISNFYSVFTAFLTVFTVAIGLLTYLGVHAANRRQQAVERVQRFRDLQLREVTNLFRLLNEYDQAVVSLRYKDNRSYKVIGDLYDKYRKPELEILASRMSEGEKMSALRKLDEDFYGEAESANLLDSASVLFRILNWIYAHEAYLKTSYMDDGLLEADIAAFRERLLGLVTIYMTNQTKFVYGKYRHLRYHLERRDWTSELAGGYRGVQSADSLFAYERTLALLTNCDGETKRKFRGILDERYRKENIEENLRYYPASLELKQSGTLTNDPTP